MSKISCLSALALLSLSFVELQAAGCINTWNAMTGNWGSAGETTNWAAATCVPGVPGSTTDEATFTTGTGVVTLADSAGTVDVSPELQKLSFINNSNYTLQQRVGGAGVINLTNSPILALSGTNGSGNVNVINVPVLTDSNTTITISGDGITTFGAASRFHDTSTSHTLTIQASAAIMFDPALITSSGVGNGFADNMAIILQSNPVTDNDFLSVLNTTKFGIASPSITLGDFAALGNSGTGAQIGSATTALVIGKETHLSNETPASLIDAASIAINNGNTASLSDNLTNNGIFHVHGNMTCTNTNKYNIENSNLQTNAISMTGNGASLIVDGTISSTDNVGGVSIDNRNNATVSTAVGTSYGTLFQITGAGTITLRSNQSLQNLNLQNNSTTDSISGSATNIGSFFNAPLLDIVTLTSQNTINTLGSMPVSGGIGAKTVLHSLNLTASVCQVINDGPTFTISGTGSIGALAQITNDVQLGGGGQLLVTNSTLITGTGTIGAKLDIGGSVTASNIGTVISSQNATNISGTGTTGAWLEVGNNFSIEGTMAAALFCRNGIGVPLTINGNATTRGSYIHMAQNCTLGNNAALSINSSNQVTLLNGIGAEIAIEGTCTTDITGIQSISVSNNGSVAGAGPSFGALLLINGTSTLQLANQSTFANSNTGTLTVTGTSNVGSFVNAPLIDFETLAPMGAPCNNTNSMSVTGGVGAKVVFNSITLANSFFNCVNDVTSGGSISGTGSIGNLVNTIGDFNVGSTAIAAFQNFQPVSGTGTTGIKLLIGGSLNQTTATQNSIACYNDGSVTATDGRGAWIEIPTGDLILAGGNIPFTFGLFCNNGTGTAHTVNGNATTVGTYTHVAMGDVQISGNAALQALNGPSSTVNSGGGIGSLIAIDNPNATFSMTGNGALVVDNLGAQNNHGVCAQLDAAPEFQMSGGTCFFYNNATVQNTTLPSNPNFASTVNFNGGFNCSAGAVDMRNTSVAPYGPSFLQNANGVVLNIATSFSTGSPVTFTVRNGLSLFPNMTVMPFIGGSKGAVINAGTMGSPFNITMGGVTNLNNTYETITNLTGTVDSIGVTFNAFQDLSLTSGAQFNLTNNLAVTGQGFLTDSTGILASITGDITANSAQINLTNTGNFTGGLQVTPAPSSYIGSHLTATNLTLQNTARLTLTNTSSNQTTSSTGCRVNLTDLLIQDSSRVSLTNTNSNFVTSSRGAELIVTGTFDMSGEYLTNVSSGGSADTSSFGSLIQSTMPIQVNAGTFINNANVRADSVPVVSGATLAGHGIFDDLTSTGNAAITTHGTTYPGDPANPITSPGQPTVGKLTINGTYTQNNDGTLFINILNAGANNFSVLKVIGTGGLATVDGTITVGLIPGYSLSITDTFNVLETSNGVIGTYDPTVVLDASWTSSLIPQIRYITGPVTFADPLAALVGPNIVQLFFINGPTPPPSSVPLLTSYSLSFEPLFDVINRDNLILEREMQRMRLRYKKEQTPVLRSSRRESRRPHSPVAQATFTPPVQTVSNTLAANKNISFSPTPSHFEQERIHEEIIAGDTEHPWNLFFGPVGDVGTINTKKHQIGSDYWVAGALASFNYVFSQAGIGFFTDYNKVNAHVHKHWGSFDFDMLHSCLYATYAPKQLPALAFHSIMGGSFEWYDVHRKTTTGTAKGKTHGSEFDALFVGEYVFGGAPCKNFTIIPRAGLQYIYVDADKYKEHGADTSDLKIHGQHAKSLRSIVDLWMKYTWEWCNAKFTPELNLGWQREFFDKNHPVYFTPTHITAPTSSVTVFGEGRNTFLAGLDLFFEFYERFALEASYDFQWNSLIRDHGFYVGFHTRY